MRPQKKAIILDLLPDGDSDARGNQGGAHHFHTQGSSEI